MSYQKYLPKTKYHVFNAVTNSELTQLVPVFTIRSAFATSVKKVNTSFKNVWRTWGPALPTYLMLFCSLGPMNFKDSDFSVPDVDLSVPVSGTRPHNCTGQRPMHAKKKTYSLVTY